MDPITRINEIQDIIRKLMTELEALKSELVGEAPVKFNANDMDILSHLRDIKQNGGQAPKK